MFACPNRNPLGGALVSDETLYTKARAGDLGAFDQLYGRYERRLFAFILRSLGNRSDAEEVFHDVFVGVMSGAAAEFPQARFVAWIFRMARNACANRLRRIHRGYAAAERLGADEAVEPGPEDRLLHDERATALAAAAGRLPEALADVFALRTSGLSYDEIADALEIPIGTVKSRMSSLIAHLRGELA